MIDLKRLIIILIFAFIILTYLTNFNNIVEIFIFLVCVAFVYQMFFSRKQVVRTIEESNINKQTITKSNDDKSNKNDRILIGKNDVNQDFYISDMELNSMCLLLGATGVGKTTAIKTLLDYPLRENQPIIIIDGKGSKSFIEEIRNQSEKHGRNFKLFSLNDSSSLGYNPIRHGGFTELKDKIINIFTWTEEHYKLQAERYLQAVFKLLQDEDVKRVTKIDKIDLIVLSQFLSISTVMSVADATNKDYMKKVVLEVQQEAIDGLANRIQALSESEIGDLFKDTEDSIDLVESIENNDIVFFSLDSLTYSEYAQSLGRLIIADIKTVAPKFYSSNKKIYTVFDEFNVFASEIVVNLINKSREFGFRNILSCQELADLTVNGDNKLMNQVLGNTNVKICMRQDVVNSSDELSKSVSTVDKYKVSVSSGDLKNDDGNEGKKYTASLEEEFIYKPREFSRLEIGQAIILIKTPKFRHDKIRIKMI